jgi:hypothetical protein
MVEAATIHDDGVDPTFGVTGSERLMRCSVANRCVSPPWFSCCCGVSGPPAMPCSAVRHRKGTSQWGGS